MNASWKRFLSQSGAVIDDGLVSSFGDPEAERRAVLGAGILCDLCHRGLISVEGEDAFTFLQGQLSCDMNQVSQARSRLAAWCSPKGRVQALFRVVGGRDATLLELPAAQLEATMRRLEMYVLRSRVTLKDVSDAFVRIGLAGESARNVLERRYGSAPRSPDDVVQPGGNRVIRLHGTAPRYEFIGGYEDALDLWRAAAGALRPAGALVWELLEILSGVPEITQGDEHLPQVLNLDALDGVSFDKGCFVGQEIIARTHYLGRLKRRMYLVRGIADEAPAAGTPIFEHRGGSEAAGQMLRSAPRPDDGGFAGLAVLRIDAARAGALRLGTADGPELELLELPYSIGGAGG